LIFGLSGLLAAAAAGAAIIVVNDSSDTLHVLGCAATGTGTCSLRDGITFANANPGPDEIDFAISGAGVHTITLGSSLPSSTGPLTIDGYTQPGTSPNTNGLGLPDNAVLLIEINGNGTFRPLSNAGGCFLLEGGQNTIRGLVINRCGGAGIEIGTSLVTGDVIEGDFIGTDPTGTIALGNGRPGVYLGNGTSGYQETVGGSSAAARNVISGNTIAGIELHSKGHSVSGNFIGTNAAGTAAIPNQVGVYVDDGVGSTGPPFNPGVTLLAGNVISGNGDGIAYDEVAQFIAHANFIGTDLTGTVAVPNQVGVTGIGNGAIGGLNPGEGNLISGNSTNGILIPALGFAAVYGNLIGTDVSGLLPLGNGSTGVKSERDVFVIGNVIAFNGAADPIGGGIVISGLDGFGTIQRNSIFENTSDGSIPNRGLGIDLGGDGPTADDSCDGDSGPNDLQNFPVLSDAIAEGSTAHIVGTLESTASQGFHIEFFSSPACDPSGYGEGKTFLGSAEVTTDASCVAAFNVILPSSISRGEFVTATAAVGFDPSTGGPGVASEFSLCRQVTEPATVVIAGCDSGVPNAVLPDGSTILDHLLECAAAAANHGDFVSCVSALTNSLKKAGVITGAQKGAIQNCAAKAPIP